MTIKLDTVDKLHNFLSLIVEESVSEVLPNPVQGEKLRQDRLSKELKPFKGRDKDEDSDIDKDKEDPVILQQEEEGESKKPVTVAGEDVPDVTITKIIDRLNILRSGKSLKDKATLKHFTEYFNALQGGEKQTLFAFLDGISTILAGGETGADATDPASLGIQVKPAQRSDKPKASKEKQDSAPIVVGEVADKSMILKRMLDLRG